MAFLRTTAALNTYVGGQLTWTEDGGSRHVVRIPVVVRPVPLAAPAEVSSTGGAISYDVKFGYDGAFAATPRGLVAATTRTATVQDDPTDSACSLTTPNAVIEPVTIPADTTYARFALFDDFTDAPDLDLCVFNSANSWLRTAVVRPQPRPQICATRRLASTGSSWRRLIPEGRARRLRCSSGYSAARPRATLPSLRLRRRSPGRPERST